MAVSISKFPCLFSPTSVNLCLSKQHHQLVGFGLRWNIYEYPYRKRFKICACSVKKSRRKVKSNEELCNDIREFILAVGLPDDHVPSTKELSDHGRTDLANIVRRRGYKLLRSLLSSSVEAGTDVPDLEKSSADGHDLNSNSKEEEMTLSNLDKQDEDAQNMTVNGSLPTVSHVTAPQDEDIKRVEDSSMSRRSSTVEQHDKEICRIVEDNSLETEVSVVYNNHHSLKVHQDISSAENNSNPVQTSANFPLESDVLPHSKTQEENVNKASMLKEKVAKFIHSGDLDVIEDDDHGILKESDVTLNEGFGLEKSTDMLLEKPSEERLGHAFSMSNPTPTMNGMISRPEHVSFHSADEPLRDDHSEADAHSGKDLDAGTTEGQNQVEINHLKSMLYEKELELSQLKELVEKEKLALSALQTKAETEISKAQKLVSEKDAELIATEESLSGLVEVKIQYCGEGDVVEVTGSFNGWHHRIRMDPHPFSNVRDSTGSRKSRVWSTMLWLYPGAYEIKFIVDGHWRIDPQRESVSRGGISNNILRVDG